MSLKRMKLLSFARKLKEQEEISVLFNGTHAQKRAKELFSADSCGGAYLEIYDKLLKLCAESKERKLYLRIQIDKYRQ